MRRVADWAAFLAGCLLTAVIVLPATGPLGAAVFGAFGYGTEEPSTPDHDLPAGCGLSSESCEVP